MVSMKKVDFKYDEGLERGLVSVTFEVTGLDKITKEVLKWQLKEFDVIFEEQHRMGVECTKFVKAETVSDLVAEIEEYIEEKKRKIAKVMEEALELRKFLEEAE